MLGRPTLPLDLGRGPLILLFYDGFERRARSGTAAKMLLELRRLGRYLYRKSMRKQLRTGFYSQFISLCNALQKAGCDVRVNDYRTAKKYPGYPIGVSGYPTALKHFPSGHPVIFGPGDFGMPDTFREVAAAKNFRSLICFCDWIADIYREPAQGKLTKWFAGIDTDLWQPGKQSEKNIDYLIYDKIRWDREILIPRLLAPIEQEMVNRKLTYRVLKYGSHAISEYHDLLTRSRSMIFLCEHETQGLAYQEAMAMDVPILAWDDGILKDNALAMHAPGNIKVTSVPYFAENCGRTFQINNFEKQFEIFHASLRKYRPRDYVSDNLSLEASAKIYLDAYFSGNPTE